jgi:hypothetical protein
MKLLSKNVNSRTIKRQRIKERKNELCISLLKSIQC